jgi:hypothetical protein
MFMTLLVSKSEVREGKTCGKCYILFKKDIQVTFFSLVAGRHHM